MLLGTVELMTDRPSPLPPQMWPQATSPASGRDLMTFKASDLPHGQRMLSPPGQSQGPPGNVKVVQDWHWTELPISCYYPWELGLPGQGS